jgi:UPF0042 nucleotide-binding protein
VSDAAADATLAVVTGLSGAGKSTALHALEDLSFFCVDNLPTPLIEQTLRECEAGGTRRVAIGIDVRVRAFLDGAARVLDGIAASKTRALHVLFLDATDEALLRRYSETRRPHPLSALAEHDGTALAVLEGVRIERERLAPLRARATHVIDTTTLSAHELRRRVVALLGPPSGVAPRMVTRLVSFGFKYGMPVDADVVLDARFLDNPHYVPTLRDLPGTSREVSSYVFSHPEALEFVEHARNLLSFALPRYEREGKAYLTIAVGCTGGRHRSVAVSERLAAELRLCTGMPMAVAHRDLDRWRPADVAVDSDVIGGGPRGKGAV